jgi:hypothetical protein
MKQTKKSVTRKSATQKSVKKPVIRKPVRKNPELFFVPPDICKILTETATKFSNKFVDKPDGVQLTKDELTRAALLSHLAANMVQVCSLTAID